MSEEPIESPRPSPPDSDEALRVAIVAALYAGDTARVRALLDVLDAKPATAPLLALANEGNTGPRVRR